MSDERSYFYTDGPSPLHEAKSAYIENRREAGESAEKLAVSLGAESAAGRGRIEGFAFKDKPDLAKWKFVCKDNKGKKLYAPKRNTKEGREAHQRMMAIKVPEQSDILRGTGLDVMRISGRYMLRTAMGWYGERIFVTIPNVGSGDKFPAIPAYLTPCKHWEMEKFGDEYTNFQSEQVSK